MTVVLQHFLVGIRNDENIKVSENGRKITISLVGLNKLFTYKGEIMYSKSVSYLYSR